MAEMGILGLRSRCVFTAVSQTKPQAEELVATVFEAWRRQSVEFIILRNYEQLPVYTDTDVDLLVTPADLERAESILIQQAERCGFRLHNRAEFATVALYFFHPDSALQVHFDLYTELKWRGFDLVDASGFFSRKVQHGSFWVPHPADEAATALLDYLLFTGRVKDKYKEQIADRFQEHGAAAIELLSPTYGRALASQIVRLGASSDWSGLEALAGTLRRTLVQGQLLQNPFRTLGSLWSDACRLSRRLYRRPGLTLVLCGPDGSGKSSIAAKLLEELKVTFSPDKSVQYHWKPPVFSSARQVARAPDSDPHGKKPRNAFASLLFLIAHWLEFVLGHFLKIVPVQFRGGLVLIDRYYYDFFVDQRRYRLRVSPALVKLGYALLPKPEVVVLLDAPVEVLQTRKQELSASETERQRVEYLDLIKSLPQGVVLDASHSIDQVTRDLSLTILHFMADRASKR